MKSTMELTSRADLLGIIADLSTHVVALQAKLDGKLPLDFDYYSVSPAPTASLILHSDYSTDGFGIKFRISSTTLNDGDDQYLDDCSGCGPGACGTCQCSDEEQLARLLPPSARQKPNTQYCAAYNEGMCKLTKLKVKTHRSADRGVESHICAFCFTKTGKKFYHAQIHCNRKTKFSNKVRSKN
jgi:hypothetical protein